MKEKYYGWFGASGYDSLVKITEDYEAYVFNRSKKEFVRNDEFLKAAIDPGSEFEAISESEAKELISHWS